MANTTPEHQEPMGAPSVRGGYFGSETALFGDPNLALYGGYGSMAAGSLPADDGM